MLIAFGHQSRVGKDTAARFLREFFTDRGDTVLVRAFAMRLKHACYVIFEQYGMRPQDHYETEKGAKKRSVKLKEIDKTPVDLWIELGMAVREIYPHTWIDATLKEAPNYYEHVLITDLRFVNEWKAVKERGDICVKVVRAGQEIQRSDKEFPDDHPWDYVLENNGDLELLRRRTVQLGNEIVFGRLK